MIGLVEGAREPGMFPAIDGVLSICESNVADDLGPSTFGSGNVVAAMQRAIRLIKVDRALDVRRNPYWLLPGLRNGLHLDCE